MIETIFVTFSLISLVPINVHSFFMSHLFNYIASSTDRLLIEKVCLSFFE